MSCGRHYSLSKELAYSSVKIISSATDNVGLNLFYSTLKSVIKSASNELLFTAVVRHR